MAKSIKIYKHKIILYNNGELQIYKKKIFEPPFILKKELLKQSYFKQLKLGENHVFLNFNYIKNQSNISNLFFGQLQSVSAVLARERLQEGVSSQSRFPTFQSRREANISNKRGKNKFPSGSAMQPSQSVHVASKSASSWESPKRVSIGRTSFPKALLHILLGRSASSMEKIIYF